MFDPLDMDRKIAEIVALLQKMPGHAEPLKSAHPGTAPRKRSSGWSHKRRRKGSGELPFDLTEL